jgi:hypothetical protein
MKTVGQKNITGRFARTALAGALGLALMSGGAQAQQQAASQDSTLIKLIRSLVDSGALKPEDGQLLLEEAQHEARPDAAQGVQAQPGDVRVPYIPQTVRDQIREEIKDEVMTQARNERWAAPEAVPEWSRHIRIEGDLRVRNESRLYSENNSNQEVDWSAINNGSGYDVNANTNLRLPPMRNTRENRNNSWRVRARLGIVAELGERTEGGVRLATGNDDSPVSATQTLGGGLDKKDVWIDQAWLAHKPMESLRIVGGRFDNPYWSTDTLFSNDLNFDGIAFQYADVFAGDRLSMFATLGVTPLEYSSDSFPGTSQKKEKSRNKWLNGMQAGAEWTFENAHRLRGAVAHYDFRRISGKLSAPCALYAGADHCDTDWSRPAFMQKGNTLMLLRNIALDPLNPSGTPQPQYVGLASEFRLLDLNLRYTLPAFGGYDLRLDGNWIKNLAYDRKKMWRRSGGGIVTNLAKTASDIDSGDTAWMAQATFGVLQLKKPGDWNTWLGYKRIEPDALPDGYNDSSFHLGGTNAKGYYLGASWMFDKRAWLSARWLSAKELVGAPLSIDVFQVEVNAKF